VARKLLAGKPHPHGATWDGAGTNFAVYTHTGDRVELCLFDADGTERERIELPEKTAFVHHGYLSGIGPGQRYGYRVHGPYDPARGLRFNPAKLLIDPYARALVGTVDWNAAMFPYDFDGAVDATIETTDDAAGVPKGIVVDPAFDWGDDRPPNVPPSASIIYEVHVKGFTAAHPEIPEPLRGTYAGLASAPSIAYLRKLGVTTVELLPVHDFLDDKHLVEKGLRNYWGYNTTNFFAPSAKYCASGDTGEQIVEFKRMVRALHAAGIEVILDVVYNHTSEGNHLGPMLSFKGIDNRAYYRLVDGDDRHYMDYTGTGNTLNLQQPQALKLVMDSLRYWVTEMHVDGFRFDLAATLAREDHYVDQYSGFLDAVNQDPVLATVKLIAEPWDVGDGGYQVGNFPSIWSEWNGKYRDTVRKYWKGDEGQLSDLASRLTGSSDFYDDGRRPTASINFVVAHDGFTLNDLVSYDRKHNEANGEDNKDGSDHNASWNCGVEGPTDDPEVNALRERQRRNLLATLLLSQGVPMICGGDEIGRTQGGNNNAYCQDGAISWYDWNLDQSRRDLLDFTTYVIALRRAHPNLRRRKYFVDRTIADPDAPDLVWVRPDGHEMEGVDWNQSWSRAVGLFMNGATIGDTDAGGNELRDDSFLLLLNAAQDGVEFTLPSLGGGSAWTRLIDTSAAAQCEAPVGASLILGGRTLTLLRKPIR